MGYIVLFQFMYSVYRDQIREVDNTVKNTAIICKLVVPYILFQYGYTSFEPPENM